MRELLVAGHLGALVPGQRSAQVGRQGRDRRDQPVADDFGVVAVGQVHQHGVAGGALDEGGDRGLVGLAHDQVAFRKTVVGPGEPGVAEVALRLCRLLGMFARLSGVPWLLIEICARSLVTDVSAMRLVFKTGDRLVEPGSARADGSDVPVASTHRFRDGRRG